MSKYIIQSILIPTTYSVNESVTWMKDHGYIVRKIHTTKEYHRFRQHTTDYAVNRGCSSVKTIPIGKKGIKMVVAYCN